MLTVEGKVLAGPQQHSAALSVSSAQVKFIFKSGFHRELGTHITKVKSYNLDKWKKDDIQLYSKMSNQALI